MVFVFISRQEHKSRHTDHVSSHVSIAEAFPEVLAVSGSGQQHGCGAQYQDVRVVDGPALRLAHAIR